MKAPPEGVVAIGGVSIRYVVQVNPRRRSAALSMDRDDQVVVKLPTAWQKSRVEAVLLDHADWILRRHEEMQRAWPVPDLKPGGWIYVLGERRGLGADQWSGPVDEKGLRQWYRREADQVFQPRLDAWSRRLDIPYTRLYISDAMTRWGYCRPDGVIGLSWRLLQAPPCIIDYVMVHELIHRRHPYHKPAFWSAVQTAYPEFRKAQQWLRQTGFALLWHVRA